MNEQPEPAVRRRLSQSWRRGSILVGLGSVAGVGLPYAVPAPSDVLIVLSLGCGLVGVVCLWLLADAFRPWVTDPGEESREHADRSVLRAYRFLVALVVTTAAYLVLWDPPLEAVEGRQVRALLWGSIGLVLLLPALLSAWGDAAEGEEWEEVSVAVLIRERFRGVSGRLHRAALVTLVGAVPLLLIGPRSLSGVPELWWMGGLALALGGLAMGVWVLARTLFRGGSEDGNA